jgi:hypothetical protein
VANKIRSGDLGGGPLEPGTPDTPDVPTPSEPEADWLDTVNADELRQIVREEVARVWDEPMRNFEGTEYPARAYLPSIDQKVTALGKAVSSVSAAVAETATGEEVGTLPGDVAAAVWATEFQAVDGSAGKYSAETFVRDTNRKVTDLGGKP